MDYKQNLSDLRRALFLTPKEAEYRPKKNLTGFIPLRQQTEEVDSKELASRPNEWLKQIQQASEEIRNSSKGSGGFAEGLATAVSKGIDKRVETKREAISEENLKKLVEKRGDTPSLFSPDKPNLAKNMTPVTFNNDWEAVAQAVKDIESSGGDYSVRGPLVTKGMYKGERAMGAYQIMPGNLPQWSKAALGREVTEEEFMNSPEIQDAIFIDQMKKAKEKHGSIEDAVSVWFSGQPVNKAGNASDGYLTTPEYVSKFQRQYKTYSKAVRN
jgi:hypothetical protein